MTPIKNNFRVDAHDGPIFRDFLPNKPLSFVTFFPGSSNVILSWQDWTVFTK